MELKENEQLYLIYYRTLREEIINTYKYFFYLDYLKENQEKYKNKSAFKLFPQDLGILLQKNICLNINKILNDSGSDVLTLYKMKNLVRENFDENIKPKNISIVEPIKDEIENIRNNMIAHNLNNDKTYTVSMIDLKNILKQILDYFNKLNIQRLTSNYEYIGDKFLIRLQELCLNSIMDF